MKKLIVIALSAMMLFAFTACNNSQGTEKVLFSASTADDYSELNHNLGSIAYNKEKEAAEIIKAGAYYEDTNVPTNGSSITLSYDVEILKPASDVEVAFSHAFGNKDTAGTFQDAFLSFEVGTTSIAVVDDEMGSNGEHKGTMKTVEFGDATSLSFSVEDKYSCDADGKYRQLVTVRQGDTPIGSMTRSGLQGTADGIFWCVYYPTDAQAEDAPYGYISDFKVVKN